MLVTLGVPIVPVMLPALAIAAVDAQAGARDLAKVSADDFG